MKKEFIRDNGKIRRCPSNIAKMNMLELFVYGGVGIHVDWKEYFKSLGFVLIVPFLYIFAPIIFPVEAYKYRKNARKEVKEYEERQKRNKLERKVP